MRAPYLQAYQPKTRRVPRKRKREESIQLQACTFLRQYFPQVIFRSDFASGLALTPAQAVLHRRLQSSRSWPDIFIYEPQRGYHGLAIELKKEGTTIVIKRGPKKGQLTSNPHIREQFFMLRELKKRGYYANFACGLDEFKRIVNWYFGRMEQENGELF